MVLLCSRCKEEKQETEFWLDRNKPRGRFPYCVPCGRAYYRRERDDDESQRPTHRQCNSCDELLPLTEEYFTKARSRKYGLEYMCKMCRRKNRMRRYYENPDAENSVRRARMVQNGPIDPIKYGEVYERDSGVCQLCDEEVDDSLARPAPMSGSIDHIRPISKGGTHTYDNVQLAHLRCNMSKGNRAA